MWKIWDDKFKHYCLTVYSREQAEVMARHFEMMDQRHREYVKNRYRIDHEKVY